MATHGGMVLWSSARIGFLGFVELGFADHDLIIPMKRAQQ
jgi:hypothetical protein